MLAHMSSMFSKLVVNLNKLAPWQLHEGTQNIYKEKGCYIIFALKLYKKFLINPYSNTLRHYQWMLLKYKAETTN